MRQIVPLIAFLALAANASGQEDLVCAPFVLSSSDSGYFGTRYIEAWGKYEYQNGSYVHHLGYVMLNDLVVSAYFAYYDRWTKEFNCTFIVLEVDERRSSFGIVLCAWQYMSLRLG